MLIFQPKGKRFYDRDVENGEKKQQGRTKMDEARPNYNTVFQDYLRKHNLHPREVAAQSGVPYMTVWNITRNKPVTREHAAQVRTGLQKMTGNYYAGPILMLV
jgi:hypothetical protein